MDLMKRFGPMLRTIMVVATVMYALSPSVSAQTYGNDGERKFNSQQTDSVSFVLDSTLVETGITQAEMESPMMSDSHMVEATPSLSQRLWDLVAEHYVITPLLILGVITAIYWLISKIHKLTI